jgi:hypothetical protein
MKTQSILAGAAMLARAACGGNDATEESRGEVAENASGTVDTEDGEASYSVRQDGENSTLTVTGPDGTTGKFVSGTGAADFLPDFAPLYPGAKVTGGAGGDSQGGLGGMVGFETGDAAEEVIGWYKDQAGRQGMKIAAEMTMGDSRMLAAEDEAKGHSFQIQIGPKDGGGSAGTLIAGTR